MAMLNDLPKQFEIACPYCHQTNRIHNKRDTTGFFSCGNCNFDLEPEYIRLHYLLSKGDYTVDFENNSLILGFTCSGTEYINAGTTVDLYLLWEPNMVSIILPLLDLDDLDETEIDADFLLHLLYGNSTLNFTKFAIDEGGLSLITDLYAHDLSLEGLENGILTIFEGVEEYMRILGDWLGSVAQRQEVDFLELQRELENGEYDTYWEDDNSTKETLKRALIGVTKIGLSAAALTGIAVTAGVPAAAIGGILSALAARRMG